MRVETARLVATRGYSAIMTDLGMIDAVPVKTTVPIVFSGHNSEATLMLRRAELEPIWSRIAMTIDALRLRRLEAELVKRCVIVTACSQNDVDDMATFAPSITQKAVVIPNGVDCETYADVARTDGEDGTILVPGSFDWLPNRRGLMWFVNEVLPQLERLLAGKNFRVRVAGRMESSFAKKLGEMSPRLTVVPNVPRMEAELQAASIIAVPVIASSGTRLRILEAWAAGRAIVTTEHGAFGLDYTDGIDLFACPEPQQFAAAAAKLLGDRLLRKRLQAAGAARAASYDWSAIGVKLLMSFEGCGLLPVVRQESAVGVESRS
jgi:glycosyltransferase involved in cell wall biosynthesis